MRLTRSSSTSRSRSRAPPGRRRRAKRCVHRRAQPLGEPRRLREDLASCPRVSTISETTLEKLTKPLDRGGKYRCTAHALAATTCSCEERQSRIEHVPSKAHPRKQENSDVTPPRRVGEAVHRHVQCPELSVEARKRFHDGGVMLFWPARVMLGGWQVAGAPVAHDRCFLFGRAYSSIGSSAQSRARASAQRRLARCEPDAPAAATARSTWSNIDSSSTSQRSSPMDGSLANAHDTAFVNASIIASSAITRPCGDRFSANVLLIAQHTSLGRRRARRRGSQPSGLMRRELDRHPVQLGHEPERCLAVYDAVAESVAQPHSQLLESRPRPPRGDRRGRCSGRDLEHPFQHAPRECESGEPTRGTRARHAKRADDIVEGLLHHGDLMPDRHVCAGMRRMWPPVTCRRCTLIRSHRCALDRPIGVFASRDYGRCRISELHEAARNPPAAHRTSSAPHSSSLIASTQRAPTGSTLSGFFRLHRNPAEPAKQRHHR